MGVLRALTRPQNTHLLQLGVAYDDLPVRESILPLIRGEVERIHEAIFAEVTYHAAYEPQRSVRTLRWKYIRRYDSREHPVLANTDDGVSKTLLAKAGWTLQDSPAEQLYDLILDPLEQRNLAQNPAHSDA